MTIEPTPAPKPALAARPPRTLLVHFGIDSAVAFLALAMLALLIDVPLVAAAVVAIVAGASAARFTRRAEQRALAARAQGTGDLS